MFTDYYYARYVGHARYENVMLFSRYCISLFRLDYNLLQNTDTHNVSQCTIFNGDFCTC